MVEYDFTEGLYRAFVRTGYKNGNNEIESIDGNKVEFRSDNRVYIFKTNPNVVVNIATNKPASSSVQVIAEEEHKGLTYTLYDNYLCIISGTQTEYIRYYYSRPFCSNAQYIYVATNASILGGALFCNYEHLEEVAFFGNTHNMTDMDLMFAASSLQYIELHNFNTSSVVDMGYVFSGATSLDFSTIDFSQWDTSNVANMRAMFSHCLDYEGLDLSGWDVRNVENISEMFSDGIIEFLNLNGWELDNLEYHTNQYPFGTSSLTTSVLPGTLYCPESITSSCHIYLVGSSDNARMYDASGNEYEQMPDGNIILYRENPVTYYTFSTNRNIKIDPTTLEVPNASLARTKSMYGLTYNLYDNGLLVISGNMTEPRDDPYNDMNYFLGYDLKYIYFAGKNAYYEELFGTSFYNVEEIAFYVGYYYRTDTQSAARMFENCNSLLNIDFGTGFYTYYVTDMTEMFASCSELRTLDFTQAHGFYASKVTSTAYMFDRCSKLTSINFGTNFTTLKLTMATGMFLRCTSLTSLDLSEWANITKLEFADDMFAGCSALTSINLGSLSIMSTTSGYYSIESMFEGCSSLISIDAARIRVKYVTNADNAFKGCSSLTYLDCSSWRPNQAYIGNNGFIDGCTALEYFSCFSPRQQITLPKTMYDNSGNAYNSLPYTTSTSDRFTVYATNPTLRSAAPKMLMSRSGGEIVEESRDFVEYNFASGELYRAFIRTGYKDAFNIDQTIDGNKFKFRNKHISYIQSQATDQFHGQYIDTGIKPSAATTVEVKVCRINGTGTSGWDTFIGCRSEYPGYAGRYVLRGVNSIVVQKSASPSASAQQNSLFHQVGTFIN